MASEPLNKNGTHTPLSMLDAELTRFWTVTEICNMLSFGSYKIYNSMLANPYSKLSLDRINRCAVGIGKTQEEIIEMIELDYLSKKKALSPEQFRRILDLKNVDRKNPRDITAQAIASGLTEEDLEKWETR